MSIRRGFMYWEVQVWSLLLSVSRFVVFAWLGALPPYLASPSFFIASRPPPLLSSSFVPSLLPVHSPFAESLRTSFLTVVSARIDQSPSFPSSFPSSALAASSLAVMSLDQAAQILQLQQALLHLQQQ